MTSRRSLLATLPLGLVLAGCVSTAIPRSRSLSLLTWNIWHNQGTWASRLSLLTQDLIAADADVIALQEVLEDANTGLPNQALTLASALSARGRPYAMEFTSTDPEGAPRRYGNAILTRLPVISQDSRRLQPLNDYRTALRVRVAVGGRPVDIVNTHLASQQDAGPVRAQQVADLMGWLPSDGTPLIVMGDFNAPLSEAGLSPLTGARFTSALPEGAAASTLNPAQGHQSRVIDHIFAETRHFISGTSGIMGDQQTAEHYPSDHFGVRATLGLR